MHRSLRQVIAAAAGPILTVVFTILVARHLAVRDDFAKGLGAALAGLVVLALIQFAEELPRRSVRWRRRTDNRAAFEGWWLQIHEGVDRVAVFSFLYAADSDSYRAEGHAFNSAGRLLAHWTSTQVFFSTGAQNASYLWKGRTFESDEPLEREGTTNLSVQRASRSREPRSGHGEVLHLNQDRVLVFRLQRITSELIQELLDRPMAAEDLMDFDAQQRLAVAFLRRRGHDGGAVEGRGEHTARTATEPPAAPR